MYIISYFYLCIHSFTSLSSVLSVVYTLLSVTQSYSGGPVNLTGQLDNILTVLVRSSLPCDCHMIIT